MAARGVLVQCIPSGNREKSFCSGALFSERWVLSLGCILDFDPSNSQTTDAELEELQILESSPSELHMISDQAAINKHTFSMVIEVDSPKSLQDGVPVQTCPYRMDDALPVAMWRCPILSSALNTVLSDWQLTGPEEDGHTDEQAKKLSKLLLSSLFLFRINSADLEDAPLTALDVKNVVMRLFQQIEIPRRGQEVVVESTLFGREFFLNSQSQGIISNKLGPRRCILLTDARSGLGCEGGPIFTNAPQRYLLGLVLSSLSWCKGEWVGFTLGLSLHPVLQHLCLGGHEPKVALNRALSTGNLEDLDRCVLLVRCGQSWGSGVIVDAASGLVLTCSHVVKNTERDVSVVWRGRKLSATLVYRTRDDVAYDLALLRINAPAPDMCQASMAMSAPQKGETVYVVGYPMFSERAVDQLSATVTRGMISHVASSVMLQTTCCVQSGASGAPVFRENGDLLAVVSCNARDLDTGALFPHVNMAVPTAVFRTPLLQFVDSGDVADLSKLEEQDELVQKMWRLNFTTSSL